MGIMIFPNFLSNSGTTCTSTPTRGAGPRRAPPRPRAARPASLPPARRTPPRTPRARYVCMCLFCGGCVCVKYVCVKYVCKACTYVGACVHACVGVRWLRKGWMLLMFSLTHGAPPAGGKGKWILYVSRFDGGIFVSGVTFLLTYSRVWCRTACELAPLAACLQHVCKINKIHKFPAVEERRKEK